jgi:hypothetical protein
MVKVEDKHIGLSFDLEMFWLHQQHCAPFALALIQTLPFSNIFLHAFVDHNQIFVNIVDRGIIDLMNCQQPSSWSLRTLVIMKIGKKGMQMHKG